MSARYIVGDTREVLASLPENSVDLVFTSPPFLALRSYLPDDHPDKAREIGSEATPADFLDTMLDVVELCDRVLAPHGSLVFELGDTYAGSGGAGGDYAVGGWRDGQEKFTGSHKIARTHDPAVGPRIPRVSGTRGPIPTQGNGWPLPKSLCGIPTLFAWSLAYGRNLLRPERLTDPWRIRNVVAWCRPNPPVGALGDKFRPGTSYLTVACKSDKRWFDLDAVRTERPDLGVSEGGNMDPRNQRYDWRRGHKPVGGGIANPAGAPPLDWWEIPTQPYKGSHYATFPEALVERPVKAMCPSKVCTVCGEPSRRITQNAEDYGGRIYEPPNFETGDLKRKWDDATYERTRRAQTVGFTDCGHDSWRAGVLLDPFAGSGTSLAVAVGHGREAIGVDLDERNAELARERVGMFLTVEQFEKEEVA